jgi:hypothetical protein
MKQQRRYLAYLLRLWQESAGDLPGGDLPRGDPPLWRASLEAPQNDELQGFASLVDLFAFLESETKSSSLGLECSDEEGSQPPAIPE